MIADITEIYRKMTNNKEENSNELTIVFWFLVFAFIMLIISKSIKLGGFIR